MMINRLSAFFGSKPQVSDSPPEKIEPSLDVKNAAEQEAAVSSDLEALSQIFNVSLNAAGQPINSTTSMKVAVVFRCVSLIAGAIAQMPLQIFDRVQGGVNELNTEHPLNDLLNLQPTPTWTAASFWEWIVAQVLLTGDAYAILLRDGSGEVVEVLPVNSNYTKVERRNGRNVYLTMIDGQPRGFDQDDVLHFPGFGFNGLHSMSVIQWGALNSIGLEMAMESHSNEFFKSGTTQSVAIIKQGKWDPEQQEKFRNSWLRTYGGSNRMGLPLVVDQSTDIKELSINARDAQLLESREFQITDIARAFGLPSFMVNQEQKASSWGSGMAEIGLAFLRFTLGPHINRFEQESNRKFFFKSRWLCKFLSAAIMRVTQKERFDAYRQAVGGSQGPGWMAVNEVRHLESLPPRPEDIYNRPFMPNGAATTEE